MASPFRVFRKNQKHWMAGLVVLAMIAFVFLTPTMMTLFSRERARSTGRENQVRGPHGSGQLYTQRINRFAFIKFLQALAKREQQAVSLCRFSGSCS